MSRVREARDISMEEERQNREDFDKNGRREESSSRAENLGSGDSRVTSTSKVKERVVSGEAEVSFEQIEMNL